jgi:hypothetical protein
MQQCTMGDEPYMVIKHLDRVVQRRESRYGLVSGNKHNKRGGLQDFAAAALLLLGRDCGYVPS